MKQSNFHDFPMLRINESPVMEIHFIESSDHPVGVGECAVAPVLLDEGVECGRDVRDLESSQREPLGQVGHVARDGL